MTVQSIPQMCSAVTVLITAVLLLNACSLAEITYNNGDWVVAHLADEYMDLDGDQKAALRSRVVTALERNRTRDLPLYEAFLENIHDTVSSGISLEAARNTLQAASVLYDRLANDAATLLAPTISTLSAEQITHLEQTLNERGQELDEKYLQGETGARLQARAQRTVGYLEDWTGSLSERQEELVKERSRVLPYTTRAWLEYRTQQNHQLVEMLRQGAGSEIIRLYLLDWWTRQDGKPRQAIRDDEAYADGLLRLIARLDATLTPKQRARATERLRNWIDILKELQVKHRPLPAARKSEQINETG